MRHFAEAFDLPIANSFRCRDYVDNGHTNYVGDVGIAITAKLAQRIKEDQEDCKKLIERFKKQTLRNKKTTKSPSYSFVSACLKLIKRL